MRIGRAEYRSHDFGGIELDADLENQHLSGRLSDRDEALRLLLSVSGTLTEREQRIGVSGNVFDFDLADMGITPEQIGGSFALDADASASDAGGMAVKVGGRDVRDYDLTALRDAVGIVLQKNLLFSGTIRDNLKWGNPDAAEEQLWAACRAAHADEFLDRMPDGLDTDLGQGGVNVSGGQKQRLCIARTLLKHPKVLIFDDSTSAVDTATESGIRRALAELTDVTKLIIAQRISSVQSADLIVILEDGRLHAVGTHAELLEKDTIYQEIYYSQMKGGDPDGE